MKKLLKQLKANTKALKELEKRRAVILTAPFYAVFSNEIHRTIALEKNLMVKKRVLRMRYRLLENIQSECIKDMQHTSTLSRELNLKVA